MVSDIIAVFTVAQPDVAGTVKQPARRVYFKPAPSTSGTPSELDGKEKGSDT
jgi:hypothetical protein